MENELRNKLNALASKTPSKWVEKMHHKQKYHLFYDAWESRFLTRIKVKYYRLKRKLGFSKYK